MLPARWTRPPFPDPLIRGRHRTMEVAELLGRINQPHHFFGACRTLDRDAAKRGKPRLGLHLVQAVLVQQAQPFPRIQFCRRQFSVAHRSSSRSRLTSSRSGAAVPGGRGDAGNSGTPFRTWGASFGSSAFRINSEATAPRVSRRRAASRRTLAMAIGSRFSVVLVNRRIAGLDARHHASPRQDPGDRREAGGPRP